MHNLEVWPSKIPEAGRGLFIFDDLPAGREIFRIENPIVYATDHDYACDFCFLNAESAIHVSGQFMTEKDKLPSLARCSGCEWVSYCSKVSTKYATNA